MPHRLHVPGAGQFEAFDAHLRDAADFLHRIVDVAIRKTGETDLTVRIVAAEISEPIVLDAAEMSADTSDDPFAPLPAIRGTEIERQGSTQLRHWPRGFGASATASDSRP